MDPGDLEISILMPHWAWDPKDYTLSVRVYKKENPPCRNGTARKITQIKQGEGRSSRSP